MDGFAAARRIREDLLMPALPIVAMTANAMASDREACLAAGTNNHVGKPFDLDHLVRVLRQHAGRTDLDLSAPAASTATAQPEAVTQAAVAAGVDLPTALNRIGGKSAIYQRMLGTFMADLEAMPALLQAHLAAGDTVAALRLLHTLKGLAATLGAMTLAAQAGRSEKLIATGTAPAQSAAAARQAGDAIVAARPRLAGLLAALSAASPVASAWDAHSAAEVDEAALLRLMQVMSGQFRNADMAATVTMAALQREFGAAVGPALQPLDDATHALNFDLALRLCNELIGHLTHPVTSDGPAAPG